MFRKLMGLLLTIFILMWVVQNPSGAGDSVHHGVSAILAFMQHAG